MLKPLLIAFLSFVSIHVYAQPANNAWNASNPLITVGSLNSNPVTGTVADATNDGTSTACSGAIRYDVWYQFVAPSNNVTISLTSLGANFTNPGLQVTTNRTTGAFGCGTTTLSPSGLTIGTTYYVRVFSTSATTPTTNAGFTITINNNNQIADARTIVPATSCTYIDNQTLYQATETSGLTGVYGSSYDVWYKFTAPVGINTVLINLNIPNSIGTTGTTYIEGYNAATEAAVSNATLLGSASGGSGLTLAELTPGNTYLFRVYTVNNPNTSNANNWRYGICISYATAPSNDNCSGATSLTVGTINTNGRLSNATASTGIPMGTATGAPDDDVWYSFNATSSVINIAVNPGSTMGADLPMIQLFSGTCAGGLTPVTFGYGSLGATGLTVGQTYFARVYTYATTSAAPLGGVGNGATFSIAVTTPTTSIVGSGRMKEVFQQTILSIPDMLNDPWEVTYGPDGYLWITEAKGYRVYRMNPATGARTTILDISEGSNFFTTAGDKEFNVQFNHTSLGAQGGLAGLALHPKLLDPTDPHNYVYVSYIRSYNSTAVNNEGVFFTNSVIRLEYNPTTGRLQSPEVICNTLPGSSDHNSQRMIVAPVNDTSFLFYAAGDMGAGQFGNQWRPQNAQNTSVYEGKILRFMLEPKAGDSDPITKWIPGNNPYGNAVWAFGIRNNQGFAYDTATGILYGSSHGPCSDDEINIIERDKNYGHPLVIGYTDGNYNGSSAGHRLGSTDPTIVNEAQNATNLGARYKGPLFSAYASTQAQINAIWSNPDQSNGAWPSEGWSGLDFYTNTVIPGWKNSLLATSLKWGRILRLKTKDNGTAIAATENKDTISYFGSINRFRDIAFAPNGKDFYVVMDKSTSTSGPSAANPIVPACRGCVQKYTFLGYNSDGSGKSTIPTSIDITPGAPNACTDGTTITISGANNNLWVPITGPDGNILAEINARGQNLGTITSSFYRNTGAIRQRSGNKYLDRNITINVSPTPASPVGLRLYITGAEFDAFKTSVGNVVMPNINSLRILKNSDGCGATLNSTTTTMVVPSASVHDTTGYVLQADISSFSTFYFGTPQFTLPLELLVFNGSLVNNSTYLVWQTTNERNTSKFIIERSVDAQDFESIGTVMAAGNSTSVLNYNFTDFDAANQSSATLYYRLRMIDMDGRFTYSNTIVVSLADIAGKLTLAPNPASHEVKATINVLKAGRAKWELIDNGGRVVLNGTVNLKTGKNVLPININALKGGAYYLTVKGDNIDQKVKLQKF